MFGSDQAASLEPQEFASLIREARLIEASVGNGIKTILSSEVPIREKLGKSSTI
jgi:N-acetylneuraminate synthase